MSMNKIIGIGANVFDTLYTIDTYPTEDTKMRANGVKECGGGPCATGLVAASKLGEIVAVHVIPRPHSDVEKILPTIK